MMHGPRIGRPLRFQAAAANGSVRRIISSELWTNGIKQVKSRDDPEPFG
jgi:hypothetical protein